MENIKILNIIEKAAASALEIIDRGYATNYKKELSYYIQKNAESEEVKKEALELSKTLGIDYSEKTAREDIENARENIIEIIIDIETAQELE